MSKCVLVVDGCVATSEPMEEALTEAGYEVASAVNGAECLRAAGERKPDLIVMDTRLAVLDGVATLNLLRQELNERLPVIMLSDTEDELKSRQAWSAAADMYLTRPVSPQAVVAAANYLLRTKQGLFPQG